MKKLILFSFLLTIICSMTIAKNKEVEVPVILTEIVVNPDGTHNGPHRSDTTIVIYQSGSTFNFGESLAGCTVTLLLNSAVVYSDFVGTDGTVIIPASFTGTFELCLTIDTQVFSAEIEL